MTIQNNHPQFEEPFSFGGGRVFNVQEKQGHKVMSLIIDKS
jgi:hypothetical protein